jgi:starch synthase
MTFLKYFNVSLAWRSLYCGVFQLERDGVTYWFVDNEYYFKRAQVYGHYDDGERFGFFSRAVLETPCQLGWRPDVIHCNDWQTALVPIYMLQADRLAPYLNGVKTVFTIHNIEYQGRYGRDILENVFGLDGSYFHEHMLSYYGDVDLMKGAIYAADFVTTVSPTYAQELRYPFYAHGLDGVIADNSYKLRGILNGIDTQLYDPWHTKGLAQNYSARQPQGKRTCKADLQREVGLRVDPDVPIVACVSRLVSHKGFDLIAASLRDILDMDLQMVVLGTGDWRYEETFRQAQSQYPGRFSARLFYSSELSSTIYAGADLLLMPSVSEPCGLSQIIAMRYGTIPLVRETGGLRDTVTPFDPAQGTGTGFTFANINAHDMCWVLREAVGLYRSNRPAWKVLMHNAMTADFGWDRSAREYIEIYQQITGGNEK